MKFATVGSFLLAVALCVAMTACGNGAPSSTATTSPAATVSSPSTSGSAATTGTLGLDQPSSSTPAVPSARRTLPAKAAPAVPPAAGTYEYSQSGQVQAGTFTLPADPGGTLVVEEPVETAGGTRQKQTRYQSSSQNREQTLLFTAEAILLEETVSRFGGNSISCKTARPLVVIKLPITVGTSWTDGGTCAGSTLSFSASVLRKETRTVGGIAVSTFVVHHELHFKSEENEQTTDLTSWLSPDYRITVRAVDHATGTVQGTQFSQDMTEELQSLSPS